MKDIKLNKTPIWFGKLVNYEYWPIWLFYIPLTIYLICLAFKARSFTFFTSVNPVIKDSGSINYSKYSILSHIPDQLKPKGILIKSTDINEVILESLAFPLVAKPDMGERGKGVVIIKNSDQLRSYAQSICQDYILQEYCDLPYEAGIFYIRKPSEKQGKITSFTTKEFLSVEGNGVHDINALMSQSFRAKLQIKKQSKEFLAIIPPKGKIIKVESIGNHNRGTKFINSNHLISLELTNVFDNIAQKIDGFYYGRFDLKYKTFEGLEKGEDIKIVELNGVNSEPTHLYDQSTGLWNAYKDFFMHIRFMYEISEENVRLGVKRTSFRKFWGELLFG